MTAKPLPRRRVGALYLSIPTDERDRLDAFGAAAGRPLSWIVRDALRLYLDAMEARPDALRPPLLDAGKAGKTRALQSGRPRGKRC